MIQKKDGAVNNIVYEYTVYGEGQYKSCGGVGISLSVGNGGISV